MKDYTAENPVFSESIQIVETTTPVHADYINAAPKQLLDNTLVLKKKVDALGDSLTQHSFEWDEENACIMVLEGSTDSEYSEENDLTDQEAQEIVEESKT